MADLIQDVDEALRRERMEKLWREHGGLILLGVSALVVGTGVFSVYKNYLSGQQTAQTEAFQAAQESPDPAAALESFAGQKSPGGLRALALLTAAGDLTGKGKIEEARKTYDSVAAEDGADPALRDYAAVMAARLAADAAHPDGVSPDERLAALDAIIANKNSPWGASARLSAALLCAGPLKDIARARQYLAPIVEAANKKEVSDIPLSLVQMAQQLDHVWDVESPAAAQKTP